MKEPEPHCAIRPARPEDAQHCGEICFKAFSAINAEHGFPCDFSGPEAAVRAISSLFSDSGFYCVVAETEGRICGSNCLDERSIVAGVGPLTVDPEAQNRGVGRMLMQSVMERAQQRGAAGVRLVQAAFHNRSLSLYTSLGFAVREPLSCLQGRTEQRSVPGCSVRAALHSDLESCVTLAQRVHGFDRAQELATAIQRGTAKVVECAGRVTGYASALAFSGHGVAETHLDLQALLASAESFGGPGLLLPSRNTAVLRWCLAHGLRIVQPMTLMAQGLYNEPAGAWFPSIMF